jgi:preprotein translocase subunit SecG
MTTLEMALMIALVIDALALAGLVLLQQGKGADIGAAFGSGSSSTVFGGAGSTSFLTKATAWLAIGFFVISFGLAYTAKERAAGLREQGIPLVEAGMPQVDQTQERLDEGIGPADASGSMSGDEPANEPPLVEDELTVPEEPVDSDIPDL